MRGEETDFHRFNYEGHSYYIPKRMAGGLSRWVEHGIYPGDFLTKVLANDLLGALGRADGENMRNIPAYGNYIYNHIPNSCHGSKEKMKAWHEKGGQVGLKTTPAH